MTERLVPRQIEKDPSGLDAKTPGAKLDADKTDVFTYVLSYFPRALEEVAKVSDFGAKKYTPFGWIRVPDGIRRYTAAMGRHVLALAKGQRINHKDGNLLHKAQVAWNVLASLELELQAAEKDVAQYARSSKDKQIPMIFRGNDPKSVGERKEMRERADGTYSPDPSDASDQTKSS